MLIENKITVFIDGSCLGNPGPGGMGISIEMNNIMHFLGLASLVKTTNNRMEIGAFLITMEFLKQHYKLVESTEILVFTDSSYFVLGWNSVYEWKKRGWKKANSQKTLLNIDLWNKIFELKEMFYNIEVKWVSRNENTIADLLSRIGSEKNNISIKVTNV